MLVLLQHRAAHECGMRSGALSDGLSYLSARGLNASTICNWPRERFEPAQIGGNLIIA